MFPFCSGASAGARGASGTEPLREDVGRAGVRLEEGEGKSGAEDRGWEGSLDLGTHNCCHWSEPASSLKRGGYRRGLNSPPLYDQGRRFFRISSPSASSFLHWTSFEATAIGPGEIQTPEGRGPGPGLGRVHWEPRHGLYGLPTPHPFFSPGPS